MKRVKKEKLSNILKIIHEELRKALEEKKKKEKLE
jgi:hypothetical protein